MHKHFHLIKDAAYKLALKVLLNDNTPSIHVNKAAGKLHNYILLDAREYDEYKVSHLENAIHIGFKNFLPDTISNIEKKHPVIVYCSVGKRSEIVTLMLLSYGFTNVKNLYGGIFEWVNQDYLVYNLEHEPTDKVHAYNKFWGKWLSKGTRVYK